MNIENLLPEQVRGRSSLIMIINRSGPRTDPCGILMITGGQVDSDLPTLTHCSLLE